MYTNSSVKHGYSLEIIFKGEPLFRWDYLSCLHDCKAYAEFIRTNVYGKANVVIYLHDKPISRYVIENKIKNSPFRLPFPLTMAFKKKRRAEKDRILGKYGLIEVYDKKDKVKRITFIQNYELDKMLASEFSTPGRFSSLTPNAGFWTWTQV